MRITPGRTPARRVAIASSLGATFGASSRSLHTGAMVAANRGARHACPAQQQRAPLSSHLGHTSPRQQALALHRSGVGNQCVRPIAASQHVESRQLPCACVYVSSSPCQCRRCDKSCCRMLCVAPCSQGAWHLVCAHCRSVCLQLGGLVRSLGSGCFRHRVNHLVWRARHGDSQRQAYPFGSASA